MANPITKFEIHLEHDIDEQYQYGPGEILRGQVILVTKEPINLKAITVQIRGEATVGWDDDGRSEPTRASESYIDASVDLVSSGGELGSAIRVDPGDHSYTLEYQLPMNLPSSFIGKYGSITYVAKATLKEDKKFGLSTTITSEPFLVLRMLDISSEPKLLLRRQEKVQERFYGTLICLNGRVSVELTIDKTGHLPGEDMQLDAEITNGSPRTVQSLQAALVMHSTFHAKNLSRSHVQVVNKKRDECELGSGDGRRWKSVRLTIPPYIPESRLDGCDIIDIRYELEFVVELSNRKELRLTIPITVGTFDGSSMDDDIRGKRTTTKGDVKGGFVTVGQQQVIAPPSPNGDMNDIDGLLEDIDLGMNDEDHSKFRHPMNPGDTRKNPLFAKD
ncbi:hypothetical protein LSH36_21g05002 [Paralvinella palmiformis]|uniref:Arrestin C-terminal-like domain-containing protein n=1 Tax=Paralvinella palmiformis TaxID=53620 RepID=A0AAD9NF66_9ANNE|nr:hypothetical protein LSH36_21g05002 [Paralvinella palmiformis]